MFSVVLDTNVLYPSLLRDLLLELAWGKVYRPVWSDSILEELQATIRRRPAPSGMDVDSYVTRLLSRMNQAFPDALIRGVCDLRLDLPDPRDVHVVACAVSGQAQLIATNNLTDFPKESLPAGIDAVSPRDFLLDCLDLQPSAFAGALGHIARRSGKNNLPVSTFASLTAHLDTTWCPGIRQALTEYGF